MVISYVGYVTQEIPLHGQKNIKIALKDDSAMLDEVVVVGYGTMKKSDMTLSLIHISPPSPYI